MSTRGYMWLLAEFILRWSSNMIISQQLPCSQLLCNTEHFYLSKIAIYCPRANSAKRRSGRKPGARVTNVALPLAKFKVVVHGRWGWDFLWYVMTSCSLISTIWRTIVSNGFDWLTRLFCSFPYHDNGYFKTCILHWIWRNEQYTQARTRARM